MKTLYLDMDGVVADFDAYAAKIAGYHITGDRWPITAWKEIVSNPHLYRDLPKTPEADELVEYARIMCKTHGWELLFLTAVPKDNDVHWAFYDKVMWAQIHFPDIPVHFGPYSTDKHVHCKPGDILIDDRLSNIEEWAAAGGIAIRHKGDLTNTIKQLLDSVKTP